MPRRFASGLAALGLLLGSCDRDATSPPRCSAGAKPDYFVPHGPDSRLVLLGCAHVGPDRKRVEFSGDIDRIDGKPHLCINPAYDGRGQRGFYIPGICLAKPPQRFAVVDAARPRVPGYPFVIWGTAPAGVTAHFDGGAVLRVDAAQARELGERPFSLFVVGIPAQSER